MKHTKGNWHVDNALTIRDEHGSGIAKTIIALNAGDGENEANAKLIAAAPELLEALRDLVEWANIKDGSPSQNLRDECLNAINKATE